MAGRIASIRRRTPTFTTTALFAALMLGVSAPALAQRTFYIDFDGGNDSADGTSPATAWKRAPGDALATGTARNAKLEGGDRLLFKGGVRYRGTVRITRSGEPGKPIVYDGSGWGDRRAIFDGSEALGKSKPCTSQAACLGSPHWRSLHFVAVGTDHQWSDWLFAGDEPLQLSQWPAIADYWDYDDPTQMAAIPRATFSQLQSGFIAVPGVPERLRQGSPVLGLWHYSNEIFFSTQFDIGAGGIQYEQAGYRPFSDRDNRFSIMNAPSEVDAPGKFAISAKDGLAIFWPRVSRAPADISIGTRRGGFLFGPASHIRIRGFSFTNFASENQEHKPNVQTGVPIMGTSTTDHVQIHDNQFRAIVNLTKMGALRLARAQNLDVRRNQFEFMPWSTAIYVSEGQGPATIACNSISRIGRNGIRILNNYQTVVERNRIQQLIGIHGAGINLYTDTRLAIVRDNVVVSSRFPITMQGHNGKPYFADPTPPDVRIEKNVLISTKAGAAAISSWGMGLRNVRIAENFLSNPQYALHFSGPEYNISLINNQISGGIRQSANTQISVQGNQTLDPEGNGAVLTTSAERRTPAGRC